nr:autophagy protein 2 B [Hymenolepis microstoma]
MCGSFLSRQVEPEDLQVVNKKIIWKNIYLNIDKINTLLGEKNLPLVISVAFISEIVAEFPLNFQINDFEIIAQTTSRHFTRQDGDMMSSLISSVTAFAFAAAKVGVEEDLSSDATDFQSIINKFDLFMRLFNRSESENSGLVDYASVAKGGRLIDNLLFKASVRFNNISIRLQCPLQISSMNRACDLRLKVKYLEIANFDGESGIRISSPTSSAGSLHSTNESPPGENSNRWSNWFLSWFADFLHSSTHDESPEKIPDKAPVMTQKVIRFEGATIHWDLWDTTKKSLSTDSQRSFEEFSSEDENETDYSLNDYALGPDAESMIASACLLSLPSSENYITLNVLHNRHCSSVMNIHPTLADLNVDFDSIFSAICPSQIFWLTATVIQLSKYFEAFSILQSDESRASTDLEKNLNLELPSSFLNTPIATEPKMVTPVGTPMFRSCIEDSSLFRDPAPVETPQLPLTMSARCRFFSLTLFHGDEEASFPDPQPDHNSEEEKEGSDILEHSSCSEEKFHEALSGLYEPTFTSGILKSQNFLFTAIENNMEGIQGLISLERISGSTTEWLESIHSAFAKVTGSRVHLQLSVANFELEFQSESTQRSPEEEFPVENEAVLPSKGSFSGQIAGLLFTECLFPNGQQNSSPQLAKTSSHPKKPNQNIPFISFVIPARFDLL